MYQTSEAISGTVVRTFMQLKTALVEGAVSDATISGFCGQTLTFEFVWTTHVPSATKRAAIWQMDCSQTASVFSRAFFVRMFDL